MENTDANSENPAETIETSQEQAPILLDTIFASSFSDDSKTVFESCPKCGTMIDVSEEELFAHIVCPHCKQDLRARRRFKHFDVLELIGRGGMGNVYKATDLNLNRLIALKVLKKEFAQSEEQRASLANESRITATVNHPNVVKVFSFGEAHGQFYMSMELIEKGSLDDLILLQKHIAEIQVLDVGIQIARGLDAALKAGLIHRDIKPSNILFANSHTVKLVDFGLALAAEEAQKGNTEIWGTPYYVAPEKLDHLPEDFRSDIYSLGGTLFHAISGRPPYEADTASMVALKQLKSQPVSLQSFAPDASDETAYVINRMLAKNPEDRYATYDELIQHLSFAKDKLALRARAPLVKSRVTVESKATKELSAIITIALLAVILITGTTAYVFSDTIFGTSETKQFNAAQFSKEMSQAAFLVAEGKSAEALKKFQALATDKTVPQESRCWVLYNIALCALLQNDRTLAASTFKQMEKLSTNNANFAFFYNLAQTMLAALDKPIGAQTARTFSSKNREALAILIIAIADWNLGKIPEAAAILQTITPLPSLPAQPWAALYDALIKRHADEARTLGNFRQKSEVFTSATPKAEISELLMEGRRMRYQFTTGAAAVQYLDPMLERLERLEKQPATQ